MNHKTFRNHISWMMFIFGILVIWVHSYQVELFTEVKTEVKTEVIWSFAERIQTLISIDLGQIAVPGFFMMSSYLFFRNYTSERLLEKWKRRVLRVLIPYLSWNILYYLGHVLVGRIFWLRDLTGKSKIPLTIRECIRAVTEYAYAPIFWYLFQLICLIILSPVIYIFVKNRVLGLIYLLSLLAAVHFHLDMAHPNTDALFYYSLAAYAAVHGAKWIETKGKLKRLLLSLGILTAGICCFQIMRRDGASLIWDIGYRTLIPLFLWILLSCFELMKARPFMCQNMFLYGIHFVIVRMINKILYWGLVSYVTEPWGVVLAMLVYLLIPSVVVTLSYGIACFLERHMPFVWMLLSGGRSLKEE